MRKRSRTPERHGKNCEPWTYRFMDLQGKKKDEMDSEKGARIDFDISACVVQCKWRSYSADEYNEYLLI